MEEASPRLHRWNPLLVVVGLSVIGLLGLVSPVSPLGLEWGHLALGQGRPVAALRTYDRVAAWNPSDSLALEALRAGARVSAVDLGDLDGARLRLRRVARRFPSHAPSAWDEIGDLHQQGRHRPLLAAQAYLRSVDLAPSDPIAPERLLKAARATLEAGEHHRSLVLFERAIQRYPEHRIQGLLGVAEAQLASGDASAALASYEEAERSSTDPVYGAYASLGAAACLERLGNLDGALAELDLAELPDDVLTHRRQALIERQADTW